MANLSIRGIPDHVHESLKAAAGRNHRSINGEILERLQASIEQQEQAAEQQERAVGQQERAAEQLEQAAEPEEQAAPENAGELVYGTRETTAAPTRMRETAVAMRPAATYPESAIIRRWNEEAAMRDPRAGQVALDELRQFRESIGPLAVTYDQDTHRQLRDQGRA